MSPGDIDAAGLSRSRAITPALNVFAGDIPASFTVTVPLAVNVLKTKKLPVVWFVVAAAARFANAPTPEVEPVVLESPLPVISPPKVKSPIVGVVELVPKQMTAPLPLVIPAI